MKKSLFSIVIALCFGAVFSGCIKNGTDRTIDPNMTATIGTYSYNADYIEPKLTKPQLNDTAITLTITSYEKTTGYKVMISVRKYLGKAGTYSIAQGEASAQYIHGGMTDIASSGIVAIKEVGASTISGYFNFGTVTGISVANGGYVVGKPWDY